MSIPRLFNIIKSAFTAYRAKYKYRSIIDEMQSNQENFEFQRNGLVTTTKMFQDFLLL